MRRPIFLVVLVAIFFISYQYTAGFAKNDPAFWTSVFPLLLVGIFCGFFAFFLWLNLRGRREYLEGCAQLNQGRLIEALDSFNRAAAKSPRIAVYEYLRAVALLQLLRLEDAERSFEKAQSMSQVSGIRDLYGPTAQLGLALQGKPALAVGDAASSDRVFTRAVEFARKAEWNAALQQLAHPSQQMLWGTMRVLRDALMAWCHAELGKEKRSLDVALLQQPGVADVATFWPDLARFLKSTSSTP